MGERATFRAQCDRCAAVFRVPSAEGRYTCKKCGGVVRTAAEPVPVPLSASEAPATCGQCSAVLPRGAQHCPECGRSVSRARPAVAEPSERRLAARDLTAARRAVEVVRSVCWLQVVLFGFLTLYLLLRLIDPQAPPAEVLGSVAWPLCFLVLSALAAAQVALQPFAWSLGLAALWSVNLVGIMLGGRSPGLLSLAIGVALWSSVVPTVRVRALLRSHPGAYGSRALLGVVAGRDIDADELQRLAVRAAWKRSALYAGGALAIAGLYAAILWTQVRPELLESSLRTFASAWNRSDVGEVVAHFERGRASAERERLEQVQQSRRWERLPLLAPLSGEEPASHGQAQSVRLPLADGSGELRLAWRLDRADWTLASLELPPPPIEAALRAFTEAWNRSDPEALAALYRVDSRARFRAYFERHVEKCGWSRGYPRIEASDVLYPSARTADVWFGTAEKRFLSQWMVLPDDSWALVTLDPPE